MDCSVWRSCVVAALLLLLRIITKLLACRSMCVFCIVYDSDGRDAEEHGAETGGGDRGHVPSVGVL